MVNLLIPISGKGSRFKQIGIEIPKPLILVGDKSLLEWSMLSLKMSLGDSAIFGSIATIEHEDSPVLMSGDIEEDKAWKSIHPYVEREPRQGAAISVKRALIQMIKDRPEIADQPIVISNCDQIYMGMGAESLANYDKFAAGHLDSVVLTFDIGKAVETGFSKWSYLVTKMDGTQSIIEKPQTWPIPDARSAYPTVGVYGVRSASLLLDAINLMIQDEGNKVNGEFYLAPSLNFLSPILKRESTILPLHVAAFVPLGTPEDVSAALFHFWKESNTLAD